MSTTQSEAKPIKSEVPQGPILGPVLFLVPTGEQFIYACGTTNHQTSLEALENFIYNKD